MRHASLANPGWRSRQLHDVDLHFWHLVDPKHVVTIEIAFYDPSLVQSELRLHDRAETVSNAAFHLCADLVGVNSSATVNGTDDTMHFGPSCAVNRNFSHLGHVGSEGFRHCDAAMTISRPRRNPAFSAANVNTAACLDLSFNIVNRNDGSCSGRFSAPKSADSYSFRAAFAVPSGGQGPREANQPCP